MAAFVGNRTDKPQAIGASLFHGQVGAASSMPITPFSDSTRFDAEGTRVLSVAFEMVRVALRLADQGERNPDLLCERALNEIRESGLARAPLVLHREVAA